MVEGCVRSRARIDSGLPVGPLAMRDGKPCLDARGAPGTSARTRPGRSIGHDVKTFFLEGRRQFSVCRAADAVEVFSGGSIRLSAARCIRLTGKSFGRDTSYASAAREVKASSGRFFPPCL